MLALYVVDFWGLGLNRALTGALWALLGLTVIDTAVMILLLSRLQGTGWRLALAVFLLFFGLKTALVAVEAVYLPDVLPPEIVAPLLVDGLITAVLFSLAAVRLDGRWPAGEPIAVWLGAGLAFSRSRHVAVHQAAPDHPAKLTSRLLTSATTPQWPDLSHRLPVIMIGNKR